MKKIVSLILLFAVVMSIFTFTASAKAVSTTLTVGGSAQSLSTHIEYANGKYYISVSELKNHGFTYSINETEYVLTRYNTEVRVPKTGSTIYKNGSAVTFEDAVILPSLQNEAFYIAADILKSYFCTSATISSSKISLTFSAFTPSVSKTVSGTISLASGKAVADMEYIVDVIASKTFSAKVTIASGANSINYSIPVYSDDTNFIIRCRQLNSDAVTGYTPTSYYSYCGTVTNSAYASSVGIASSVDADIEIPKAVTVSGDITGTGEGYLLVENSAGDVIGSTEFYSSSTASYSVTIPGKTENAHVRYKIYSGDGIVRYGYLTNNGTSAFETDSVKQSISINSVFNLEILTGNTISGTISWDNANASYCTIRAMTPDGKHITDPSVYTSDANEFSIIVPGDTYTDYVLVVNTDDCSYAKYASADGLTSAYSEAVSYSIAKGDVSDAAVIIDNNAKTSVLYGQLKLPEGLTASEDISVTLYAGKLSKNTSMSDSVYSIAKTYTTTAVIPAGETSADYSISLGNSYAGENIALGYISGASSIPNGYFDGYNTTLFSTDKDISFSAEKINNIDLYVYTESGTDITAVRDIEGNDYSAATTDKNTVVLTLKNLTNIDKNGKLFVGAYNSTNTLISSAYVDYTAEGSSSEDITVELFGKTDNAAFLKILTLNSDGNMIARDIVIL